MENLLGYVEKTLDSLKMEMYSSRVYHIKCADQEKKNSLKQFFPSNSSDLFFTTVELDFVKEKKKLTRKARIANRNARVLNTAKYECLENTVLTEDPELPNITVINPTIYIYGRYYKYSRNITQTPLIIGGALKTERSVSDFGEQFRQFYDPDKVGFIASGREDIDVRCTGGRPFVLEIVSPKKNLKATSMPFIPSQDVEIQNCAIVSRECRDKIVTDEPDKTYDIILYSQNQIEFQDVYNLKQKTPLRVLHRRANITREKNIRVLKVFSQKECDGFYYLVRICASGGAYIKEWVNGDFGRTVPNLGADLLTLDVSGIESELEQQFVFSSFELNKQVL